MKKIKIDAYRVRERVKQQRPMVHHLTNWVTIYDCAQVVKSFGASPVMAHAAEEAGQMAGLSSALVLNIGTITSDLLKSMKLACRSANKKGIPVILDCCGAGATVFRDESCFSLLREYRIDIVKGNASEIARMAGENVRTKGVDSSEQVTAVEQAAKKLASQYDCAVVATGKEDIVTDGRQVFVIKNGHELMSAIVGTGCMVASVIGAFAAVEKDLLKASLSALLCFEVAAELAAKQAKGPGSFKEALYDRIYRLDRKNLQSRQKVFKG